MAFPFAAVIAATNTIRTNAAAAARRSKEAAADAARKAVRLTADGARALADKLDGDGRD